MDISLKLGMFFFLYYFVTGLAMLTNPRHILRGIQDIFANHGLMILVGFMALMLGLLIISFHGYYELHWPLLITILGWLAVFKGFFYLVADNALKSFAKKFQTESTIRIYGLFMFVMAIIFACNIFRS